ncbi:hypothetical protein B0T26DRAFT_680004 [Lasiosphaeria miniovina]|uniref:Fungal N-terminal domain-containing protein n=1 Tax=Lasiosphaeria miniovina TaxID=1954250 RepID=A0AA39ZZ23_9PEZI|nr:uncharacterized protein B0T26DRAFT_680004 [Lasiosphaeria miniovina]KAK0706301.1 hypothetical protein B0T26DRAFT_680004 [Lasiosphaeria miniovina]
MDPISTFSLAVNVLTLVDMAVRTGKTLSELYKSTSGFTRVSQELIQATDQFEKALAGLNSVNPQPATAQISGTDEATAAKQCRDTIQALKTLIDQSRAAKQSSVRTAMKSFQQHLAIKLNAISDEFPKLDESLKLIETIKEAIVLAEDSLKAMNYAAILAALRPATVDKRSMIQMPIPFPGSLATARRRIILKAGVGKIDFNEQKTMRGLVRGILYDVLRGNPEVAHVVFPEHWAPNRKLHNWAKCDNVKLCVSSREEPPIMKAFLSARRVTLHTLTRPDVMALVRNRLELNPHFQTLAQSDPTGISSSTFQSLIVHNAEGVYMWFVLLLKLVEEELAIGSSFPALQRLVETTPQDLDQFFARILESVPKHHSRGAYLVFAMMLVVRQDYYDVLNFPFRPPRIVDSLDEKRHSRGVDYILIDSRKVYALLCTAFAEELNSSVSSSMPLLRALVTRGADLYLPLNDDETMIHFLFQFPQA